MNKNYLSAIFIAYGCIAPALYAQRPVILTEPAGTTGKHKVDLFVGVEYLQKLQAPLPQLAESITRVAVIGWHQGVADNVNIDVDWRGYLFATLQNGSKVQDWGDITVSTRVQFLDEQRHSLGLSLRNSVKLPNTRHTPHGLGSDETDYFSHLLVSKHWGEVETRLNVGFGIVGDPKKLNSQDDVYIFSGAAVVPAASWLTLFGEAYGLVGYFDNDDKLIARFGGIVSTAGFDINLFGSAGIAGSKVDVGGAFEASETWSIGLAVKKSFELGFLKSDE